MKNITERALRAERFEDLEIIDMHCHLSYTYNYYFPRAEIEDMMEDAGRMGVSKLCVAPHIALSLDHRIGNRDTLDAIRKFPDRVLGMLVLNPNCPRSTAAEFDAYYAVEQFVGAKIHPTSHRYPVDGPNYRPVFEQIRRRGGFVLVHTWEHGEYNNAAQCEGILRDFPDVKFIFAHAFGVNEGVPKSIDLVNRYGNAYMDTSGFEFSDVCIEWIMRRVDHDKVFFGSDLPFHDIRGGASRILLAGLEDDVKRKLLGANFRAFLNACAKRS